MINFATATLAGLLLVGTIAEASAWTRQGTVTTARGTYTVNGAGSCAGGTCSRARTVTGPNGGTVTRSGSVTKTSPGQYQYSRTTTGPPGGTVTRSGTVVVAPPAY
jgi:hypothetical protein